MIKKCIVTGSGGFLGQHLVKKLKKEGYDVVEWDISNGNDVCDMDMSSLSPYTNLVGLFHLACPVDPGNYKKVALPTALASSIGTYNMLDFALRCQTKFLYVSSSDIYGHSKEFPYREDNWGLVDPVGERSYYSESKRFGEMLTMVYHRYEGLDARIVRPFNIYGPGMRYNDSRVIPSFFRCKKENKPLTITGSGDTTRTFCYVDDFIDAIFRAMFYPDTNGQVFNIGTEEELTMLQLAKLISDNIQLMGDIRIGEQLHRRPDIQKAKEVLQWQPTTSLEEGLKLTWASYQ